MNNDSSKYASVEFVREYVAEEIQKINAKDINTDQNHRYISDALLGVFKEKPSNFELQNAIADAKMDMDGKLRELFNKLLNSPDALNKIKILMDIVSENSTFSALMDAIGDRLDYYEFDDHVNSGVHLTNNDRKALNVLIELIKNGGIDWEADSSSICSIKNKPKSFKADGGNADTVGGLSVDEICGKNLESIIIGSAVNNYDEYDKTSVDIMVESKDQITEVFNSFAKSKYSKIGLKSGNYLASDISIRCDSEIIITGSGTETWIGADSIILENVTLKDVKISCPNVRIMSNCTLDNVQFVNCSGTLVDSMCSRIINCKFNNSIITFEGACTGNIIDNNIMMNGSKVICLGKNNMIGNNLNL